MVEGKDVVQCPCNIIVFPHQLYQRPFDTENIQIKNNYDVIDLNNQFFKNWQYS